MDLLHSFFIFKFFWKEEFNFYLFMFLIKIKIYLFFLIYFKYSTVYLSIPNSKSTHSLCFLNSHIYGFSFMYIENLFNLSFTGGHFGTCNVRSMNQDKLEVVKQEMARVNVDSLGISKLKWTGMGEFNSDDHYIYYCR